MRQRGASGLKSAKKNCEGDQAEVYQVTGCDFAGHYTIQILQRSCYSYLPVSELGIKLLSVIKAYWIKTIRGIRICQY